MATYNKFQIFVQDLANGVHNLGADQLSVYLSNTAPDPDLDLLKADLAEIATGNGYAGPQNVTVDSSVEAAGTYTLAVTTDIVITATGPIGPFRYVPLFNNGTAVKVDPLIGWWDYGASISLTNAGETFTIDFTASIFTLT